MADEQQQSGGAWRPPQMMQAQASLSVATEDYEYQTKPTPKPEFLAQAAQQGGMAAQFDAVSSGLNKNV